jgi:hypothetical protein
MLLLEVSSSTMRAGVTSGRGNLLMRICSAEVPPTAAGGSTTPSDDRNRQSLPLSLEVKWIRESLHQEMLPTVQVIVGEMGYIWRYTVNESEKGLEE